jgi:hypothetical protein
MSAFRKRAEMFVLPLSVPLNTPQCEPKWEQFDVPTVKRVSIYEVSRRKREETQKKLEAQLPAVDALRRVLDEERRLREARGEGK